VQFKLDDSVTQAMDDRLGLINRALFQ